MKKNALLFSILVLALMSEIYYLSRRNVYLTIQNNQIHNELKENNLIKEDGTISLADIKREEENIKQDISELLFDNKNADITTILNQKSLVTTSLNEEITSLETEVQNLETTVSELQAKYNDLINKKNEESIYIKGVPTINQNPDYPTGCESVALTILLNYYGVAVTPDDIIGSLPKGELPYSAGDKVYGGNPEKEFIGNPYSQNSFGVYEKPLAVVANSYKQGIHIATGTDFDTILNIVKQGRPVMVWTSMNLIKPYISMTWTYKETGETIYWKANEHAVVIAGYTNDKVIISDPIGGKIKYQSRSIFKERYDYFGKKALYY